MRAWDQSKAELTRPPAYLTVVARQPQIVRRATAIPAIGTAKQGTEQTILMAIVTVSPPAIRGQ